jgi:hypothetical protein
MPAPLLGRLSGPASGGVTGWPPHGADGGAYGSPFSRSAPSPAEYFGAYAYSHDVTGAFHSRYGALASLDAQLIAKREMLLQQVLEEGCGASSNVLRLAVQAK